MAALYCRHQFAPLLQGKVVDEPARSGGLRHLGFLLRRWVEAEQNGLARDHLGIVALAYDD